MQGLRNVLERSSLIACGALCLGLSQCGGEEFSSPQSSAGTAASGSAGNAGESTGGSPGQGGSSGGDSANAGSAAGGVAGKGGAQNGNCDCPAGSYCREGSIDCFMCSDLSRVYFETPVRLAPVSDNGQGSRFPRIGATSTDLLYHFEGVGMRYTTDSSTSAGNSVASTLPEDNAPLLLREEVKALPLMGLSSFNFLFDRAEAGTRKLIFGKWSNGLQTAREAPAPFNGGGGDYSIAVALHPTPDGVARAFWMTNADATNPAPRLVTAPLVENAAKEEVALKIGSPRCGPLPYTPPDQDGNGGIDPDMTPWVTSDGRLLVFSTTRLDADCQASTQKRDVYTTLLQASSGQPPMPAQPMNDVNSPEDDVDPSFSADLCDLYFASNREGAFAVYRAHRR
jgi:hypothetical protein